MSPLVTALSSQHVSLLIMLGKSHNIFILINVMWLGGQGAGLASRRSRVRFPAAAASTGMGDRLRAGKPPQYFTKPSRPTQPPTLSGNGTEYHPKCGDAV